MTRPVPSVAALDYISSCLRSQTSYPLVSSCRSRSQHIQSSLIRQPCHRKLNTRTTPKPTSPVKARIKIDLSKTNLQKNFTLDEDIPFTQMRVRNKETGKLGELEARFSLLNRIDRDKQVVNLLSDPNGTLCIVEITDKATLNKKLDDKEERAAQRVKLARTSKPKQIELNWAISGNDLDMKLRQLREFLDKGKRVEIMLASKKRQRKGTPEEAENVVRQIRNTVADIQGCTEVKPMQGKIGAQAILIYQGIALPKSEPKSDSVKVEDGTA